MKHLLAKLVLIKATWKNNIYKVHQLRYRASSFFTGNLTTPFLTSLQNEKTQLD